jgi:hypothetical protein
MPARENGRFALFFLVTSGALFLPAGTLAWPHGWMFMELISASVASVSFGIFRDSPELLPWVW